MEKGRRRGPALVWGSDAVHYPIVHTLPNILVAVHYPIVHTLPNIIASVHYSFVHTSGYLDLQHGINVKNVMEGREGETSSGVGL